MILRTALNAERRREQPLQYLQPWTRLHSVHGLTHTLLLPGSNAA